MGIDQDRNIIECVDSIPPEMRIGFSHGSHDSEYEFYLDIDPLVSLDKLNAPLTNQLRRALHVFAIISRQMGVIQFTGTPIVKDLERLVKLFKQDDEPFVTINGIRHSVELLNSQQVEQAYLIIKDIVSLSRARSHALMDYILQQGDQVDLQVIKDDPKNHKVIIFSKKLTGSSKKKKSGPSNPR
ncbi:uncharacterized protein LOC110233942 isoform X2 [Exaiptasia diaphana]|nr:uncharacterized protein LOC110233942 isoform X2 [Exaiptasia diaphana]